MYSQIAFVLIILIVSFSCNQPKSLQDKQPSKLSTDSINQTTDATIELNSDVPTDQIDSIYLNLYSQSPMVKHQHGSYYFQNDNRRYESQCFGVVVCWDEKNNHKRASHDVQLLDRIDFFNEFGSIVKSFNIRENSPFIDNPVYIVTEEEMMNSEIGMAPNAKNINAQERKKLASKGWTYTFALSQENGFTSVVYSLQELNATHAVLAIHNHLIVLNSKGGVHYQKYFPNTDIKHSFVSDDGAIVGVRFGGIMDNNFNVYNEAGIQFINTQTNNITFEFSETNRGVQILGPGKAKGGYIQVSFQGRPIKNQGWAGAFDYYDFESMVKYEVRLNNDELLVALDNRDFLKLPMKELFEKYDSKPIKLLK